MSGQTESISSTEKLLFESVRMYRALEAQIGLAVLNSRAAQSPLPEESAADAELYLKLQKDKDDLNRGVQELRECERRQKECAAELSKLKQLIKSKTALRLRVSEAFGRALAGLYADNAADVLKEAYKEVFALEAKINQGEEELREKPPQSGFFASIKTSFDRSAKRTSLLYMKQKLSKAYAAAGTDAFQNAEINATLGTDELPGNVQSAYKNMAECEQECRALNERQDDLMRRINEDNDAVSALVNALGNTVGISAKAGSAAAKIREIEKEINKAEINERMCAARVGKRFIEAERASGGKVFEEDIAPLLERAKILQDEINAHKATIEKAKREIEAANISKAITSLENQIANIEKRIGKLSAEKTGAEDKIKLLSAKLTSLRVEE